MNKAPQPLHIEGIDKKLVPPQVINFALALLALFVCLGAGSIHFYFSHRFLPLAQLIAIVITGCAFAFLFVRESKQKPPFFIYGLVIALCVMLGLAFIYSVKEDFEGINLAAMVCAFLVPVLIAEAWQAFKGIKAMEIPVWVYGNDIPAESKLAYFDNKPLRVKLMINHHSRLLKGTVPSSLLLGDSIFNLVKKDKDQHGEDWKPSFINENGEPYEWIFYSNAVGFIKKYFDPYDTVFNNGLKANQTIIVKRVE